MQGARPLSPGRTRGREYRHAAEALALPNADGTTVAPAPGEHSVWCDVLLIERGCIPLLATGVVVVLTESKVFLRIAATAFTFTIHLQDVALLRHVARKEVVELHVRLPTLHVDDATQQSGLPPLRLYRLTLTERRSEMSSAQLYDALRDLLPFPDQRRAAQESVEDDAIAAYLVDNPCSMLPRDLLARAGLREVECRGEKVNDSPLNSASTSSFFTGASLPFDTPPPLSVREMVTVSPPKVVQANSPPVPSFTIVTPPLPVKGSSSSTTGHLRKIYVAPSPASWRLPREGAAENAVQRDANMPAWSYDRGPTSLPQKLRAHAHPPSPHPHSTSTGPTTAARHREVVASPDVSDVRPPHVHRHRRPTQEMVDMSSRESSLMAGVCGLRHVHAPPSASSSQTSQTTDRTLRVQYGPIVSG